MSDTIADLFLGFSHTSVVFLMVLFGFFALNRVIFFQAFVLGALDLVANVTLKGLFKVPLPAYLHEGYAFPSGHMQFSTVFYLWLAICLVFWWWRIAVLLLLCGIGASLYHYDYHQADEIMAGFFFGVLLVGLFRYAQATCPTHLRWILCLGSSLLMIYNHYLYLQIPMHAVMAYGVLMIVIIVERFFVAHEYPQGFWYRASLRTS